MTGTTATKGMDRLTPELVIKMLVERGDGRETVEEIRRQFVELVGMQPATAAAFAGAVEHYRERHRRR